MQMPDSHRATHSLSLTGLQKGTQTHEDWLSYEDVREASRSSHPVFIRVSECANNNSEAEMENEKQGNPVAQQAMLQFGENIKSYTSTEQLLEFAMTHASLCISLIEGIEGKDFVEGFLAGAISDKDRMVIKPMLVGSGKSH